MKNVMVEYKITRDEDGLWCIQGTLPGGQVTSKVYAKDTAALTELFLLLDGSQPVFCGDAVDKVA